MAQMNDGFNMQTSDENFMMNQVLKGCQCNQINIIIISV